MNIRKKVIFWSCDIFLIAFLYVKAAGTGQIFHGLQDEKIESKEKGETLERKYTNTKSGFSLETKYFFVLFQFYDIKIVNFLYQLISTKSVDNYVNKLGISYQKPCFE